MMPTLILYIVPLKLSNLINTVNIDCSTVNLWIFVIL